MALRWSVLSETDLARARRWVDARNEQLPPRARGQIRYELDVDDRSFTVLECRPPWDPGRMGPEWTRFPIARFRYTKARREWTLYWRDRNLRFHRFDIVEPSARLQDLIDAVEDDRTGIFWG